MGILEAIVFADFIENSQVDAELPVRYLGAFVGTENFFFFFFDESRKVVRTDGRADHSSLPPEVHLSIGFLIVGALRWYCSKHAGV